MEYITKNDYSAQSMMKMNMEMGKKVGKLEMDLAKMRKENAKLREEIGLKNREFERQIAKLNAEIGKLKKGGGESRVLEWQMEEGEEEAAVDETGLAAVEFDVQIPKNELERIETFELANPQNSSENNFLHLLETTTNCAQIKKEGKNGEANAQIGQQIRPSILNGHFDGNGQIEAEEFEDNFENNFENNDDEKIELDEREEESGIGNSRREEEAGTSSNSDEYGQIKCSPIKIGNTLKCNWPACEYRTKSNCRSQLITQHWLTHTGERPFVCQKCGQSFGLMGTLRTHEMMHTDERPYPCRICGKSFRQSSKLTIHLRIHTGERPYGCEECGQKFKRLDELKKHRQKTHI